MSCNWKVVGIVSAIIVSSFFMVVSGRATAHTVDTPTASEIILIVDRSGSMSSIVNDMKPSLNKFVQEQKDLNEEGATIRMIQFDTEYEEYYSGLLKDAPEVSLDPRGGTALLDALGTTFKSIPDDNRLRIIFIVTDGEENSSMEWDADGVKDLFSELDEDEHFKITYLGSNQDAILMASNWGQTVGTLTYTSLTVDSSISAASSAITDIRTGSAITLDYTDEQLEEALQE